MSLFNSHRRITLDARINSLHTNHGIVRLWRGATDARESCGMTLASVTQRNATRKSKSSAAVAVSATHTHTHTRDMEATMPLIVPHEIYYKSKALSKR